MKTVPRDQSYASHGPDFRSGKDSPLNFLEMGLARMEKHEAKVRAFTVYDCETARIEAKASETRWRSGQELSPIDGMPIGIKDIIETYDMPTGQGSPLWDGHESKRDSATVQALREAGAIIVGKTVTTEFAASTPLGKTVNPHDPRRTPGGSSSGSTAAVGAGFIPVALGSQVVGSTLRPSSYCGCIGFKPSVGAINRGGSYDYLSHSCVGVIGASLDDLWLTAKAIVNRVGGDPGYVGLIGPETLPSAIAAKRVLVLETDGWSKRTVGAAAAFDQFLKGVAEVEFVGRDHEVMLEDFEQMITGIRTLSSTILSFEGRWPLGGYIKTDETKVSATARQRFCDGKDLKQEDYAAALERRNAIRETYAELTKEFDAVITLAATGAAPLGLESTGDADFNIPASVLGVPAISLPVLSDGGLPLGLQLIGKANRDAELIGLAHWFLSKGLRETSR